MPDPLAGRVALVTGAGRGIGRDIARWLADAGADVVVCARTPDGIAAVADEIRAAGRRVIAVVCDVADPDAVSAMVDQAIDDSSVASTSPSPTRPSSVPSVRSTRCRHDEWLRTLAVNVGGTASLVRAVLPVDGEERLSGAYSRCRAAGVGGPNLPERVSAYVASKGAVMVLTEAIASELPAGVTINAIAPGAVPTGFMDEVARRRSRRGRSSALRRGAVGGRARPAVRCASSCSTWRANRRLAERALLECPLGPAGGAGRRRPLRSRRRAFGSAASTKISTVTALATR